MHTATYVGLFTLIVCLGGIAALIWAIRNRQFEEERRAVMSVFDDEPDFPQRFPAGSRRPCDAGRPPRLLASLSRLPHRRCWSS